MIVKEIERGGIPAAHITAMVSVSRQIGANRVVTGTKIPHPLGDPNVPPEADLTIRREIVKCALTALQSEVSAPTIFVPNVSFTSG